MQVLDAEWLGRVHYSRSSSECDDAAEMHISDYYFELARQLIEARREYEASLHYQLKPSWA